MVKTILFLIFCATSFSSFSVPNWSQRADFPGNGRHRASAFSIGTKGYQGVGHYNGTGVNIVLKDWWEFDPSTNSWTQKADYTGNGGNGNYGMLTFTFADKAYLGGGQLGSASEFFRFDPQTNTWIAVASPPVKPQNTTGFTVGDKGYYILNSNLWEYNSTNDQWANKGATPFSVGAWNSAFTISGKGYIKTGQQIWEYKPLTNQWIMRASFPGLATGGSGAFVQNGKGYIVTGYSGGLSNVTSEVWEFDPNANSWLQYADFPGTSRRFSNTFNVGEKAFLSTGTNGTNFGDLWEFNLTVGLNDLLYDNSFITYPNPATEKVTFHSDQYNNAIIHIYSSNGDFVKTIEMENSETTLFKDNLQKGNYFYTVEVDNQRIHSNQFIFL